MAFDPDKYLEKKAAAFDPDAYLASKAAPSTSAAPSDVSQLESALRGAAQGATFDFADELQGAAQGAYHAATDEGPTDLKSLYQKYRDLARTEYEKAQAANPKSYLAGGVAGGLASALALPGAGALGAGEGLTSAALQGAKLGGLAGLGASNSDLTQGDVLGTAGDVAKGAAVGGIMGAVTPKVVDAAKGVGKAIVGIPDSLEKLAANRAIATGGSTSSERKLLERAPTLEGKTLRAAERNATDTTAAAAEQGIPGNNRLLEQGKNMLEKNDYLDTPLVTPGATPETVLERSRQMAQNSGKAVGDVLTSLDETYSPETAKDFFNPQDAIKKLEALKAKTTRNGNVLPDFKNENARYADAIDTIKEFGDKPISFKDAHELKQMYQAKSHNEAGGVVDDIRNQVRGIINDGIEDAADKVASKSGDPALADQYIKAKDVYRTARDAERMSSGQAARNLGHRDLGITDFMSGAIGLASHGTPGGIAAIGLKKLGQTYGNSVLATGAKAAADAIRDTSKYATGVGKTIADMTPDFLKQVGESFSAAADPIQASLGKILESAAGKDQIGRNALIFSLMQNPKYREHMRSVAGATSEGEPKNSQGVQ